MQRQMHSLHLQPSMTGEGRQDISCLTLLPRLFSLHYSGAAFEIHFRAAQGCLGRPQKTGKYCLLIFMATREQNLLPCFQTPAAGFSAAGHYTPCVHKVQYLVKRRPECDATSIKPNWYRLISLLASPANVATFRSHMTRFLRFVVNSI